MAYQVQWDTTTKATKKNYEGTSGWVKCLAIRGRTDVYTYYGLVTVGSSFRMHLCSETRCVAHWEESKYGVMGQPLHLILEEAPAPDHVAGPAVAGPLSMPGAVEEPEANADTPGNPVPESIPDAAEEPEAKVDTPAVAMPASMPGVAEEPGAMEDIFAVAVSESMSDSMSVEEEEEEEVEEDVEEEVEYFLPPTPPLSFPSALLTCRPLHQNLRA